MRSFGVGWRVELLKHAAFGFTSSSLGKICQRWTCGALAVWQERDYVAVVVLETRVPLGTCEKDPARNANIAMTDLGH